MPPAKKPAARKSASKRATPAKRATAAKRATPTRRTATSNGAAGSMTAATRRQLETAVKRLEKALDDASSALQSLAKDAGHGGSRAYKELGTTLKALQREAQKHNKALAKDLGNVRASVATRATRATSTRKTTSSARKTTTRRAAAKPASRRRAS